MRSHTNHTHACEIIYQQILDGFSSHLACFKAEIMLNNTWSSVSSSRGSTALFSTEVHAIRGFLWSRSFALLPSDVQPRSSAGKTTNERRASGVAWVDEDKKEAWVGPWGGVG